jgi:hypothetical protein
MKRSNTWQDAEQRCYALPYPRDHIYYLTCEQSVVEEATNEGTMLPHLGGIFLDPLGTGNMYQYTFTFVEMQCLSDTY